MPDLKKRKRQVDPQQEYYDRLVHQCRKDLLKQIKICKSFECQKIIRKTIQQNEQAYAAMKQLAMDLILQECFRRMGIVKLNPSYDPETNSNDKEPRIVVDDRMELILKHKRMQESLEKWNNEVTEYRRWCLKQRERGSAKAKVKKQSSRQQAEDLSSSLFVKLGDSDDNEEDHDEYPPPTDDTFYTAAQKKNRPGQRARKAKAAAIQAKEQGIRAPQQSLNWRLKKKHESDTSHRHDEHDSNGRPTGVKQQAEALHPSWEAKKAKKEGIVEFQGTKITFN
jgi:hypothetical protein